MKVVLSSTIALSAMCAIAALRGADQPKFEEASVKRANLCSLSNSLDPGMITLRGDPLDVVLMEAFKVKTDQIAGPSWLDKDCFEITAKMPEGATKDQIPAMLQALLIERFKLSAHKERRPRKGYALVVDKNGPKFKESDPTNSNAMHAGQTSFRFGPGTAGINGSMTMESLARHLSSKANGPVQDFTGLKGKYDIDLSWTPDPYFEQLGQLAQAPAAAHPNDGIPPASTADLLTSVRTSLGLRLDPRKLSVEVLVIDHIERVPTEN